MAADDRAAREALRARQGSGARYDAETAPQYDLLLARRGTAYFSRKLGELADGNLSAPSLRDGWSRRRLIADVSHRARALALALKALREPLIPDEAEWRPDLDLAETLPPRALRHLYDHSAKHLDVEWRDLPAASWEDGRVELDGTTVAARETARLRAFEIWHAAVDLGNGGRRSDIPQGLRKPS